MVLQKALSKISGLEEKLGEYLLVNWTLLGAGSAAEIALNKTMYLGQIYLEYMIPILTIGSMLYIHGNLKSFKNILTNK